MVADMSKTDPWGKAKKRITPHSHDSAIGALQGKADHPHCDLRVTGNDRVCSAEFHGTWHGPLPVQALGGLGLPAPAVPARACTLGRRAFFCSPLGS